MEPILFLEVLGGVMATILGVSITYNKWVITRIQLATRLDIDRSRTEQQALIEMLRKQVAAIEEIKINTNNLMTESLKNKGLASHAEGVAEGKRLANAEYALMEAKATAAAYVLKEAAEDAAKVLREAADRARRSVSSSPPKATASR